MDNKEAFQSNTSILINDGKEVFKKWNGNEWEEVYLSTEAPPQEEMDHLEDGLPMKVMKFMGLPKSYRHTLYTEFVQDVKQIPADTASSFFNIVSWVCGKNEEGDGNDNSKIQTETATPVGEGDTHTTSMEKVRIISPSSTDSMGSSSCGNVEIVSTDSISNLKIATPIGILVDEEKRDEKPVQVIEAIEVEIPDNKIYITPSMHGVVLEDKTPHVLEIDDNGNVTRTPYRSIPIVRRPCSSETSIYGHGFSETESEEGYKSGSVGSGSIPTTPLTQSEKEENREEEVKRVTFASPSETNIYAYQDYDGEETEEDPHTDTDSKKSDSETLDETNKADDSDKTCISKPEILGSDTSCTLRHEKPEDEQGDSMGSANNTPPWSAISEPSSDEIAEETEKVPEKTIEKIESQRKSMIPSAKKENQDPPVKNIMKDSTSSTEKEKLPPSTSEVQLQLNKDLKTLEDIVKNIYKNLNKKGPLTIVANFKPKEDGELALDMGSLTGTGKPPSNVTPPILHKPKEESIPKEPEDKEQQEKQPEIKRSIIPEEKASTHVKIQQRKEQSGQAPLKPQRHFNKTLPQPAPVVGIMKNTSNNPRPKTPHPQHSSSLTARKSMISVPRPSLIPNKSRRSALTQANTDKNNNIDSHTPLKPAIKHCNRMPSLRPAASSHSVTRTCINPSTDEEVVTPAALKSSRSKHYLVKVPSKSKHLIMEQPAPSPPPPQHFKILEGSDSQRYLVPVTPPQTHKPKQLFVSSGVSSLRSSSQHLLLETPQQSPPQPQQLFVETPKSQHIYLEAPQTSHMLMENPHAQQIFLEAPPRPQNQQLQHIIVETPPPLTCQKPHLHPRTATILPPSSVTRFHTSDTSSPQQNCNYRIIQPCGQHHPQEPHNNRDWENQDQQQQQEDSATEESASNASMGSSVSSTFTGAECELTGGSGGETVAEEEIPIHLSRPSQQSYQSQHNLRSNRTVSLSSKPSDSFQTRRKQSTDKVLVASQSATKQQQYRTTLHIPTGPPKPNSYRAIFKEKQQQQTQQTVYVDLTTKGLRKNR